MKYVLSSRVVAGFVPSLNDNTANLVSIPDLKIFNCNGYVLEEANDLGSIVL